MSLNFSNPCKTHCQSNDTDVKNTEKAVIRKNAETFTSSLNIIDNLSANMKIAIAISSANEKELKKLLMEQNKLYTYDGKIINKVLDVYGSEIKKLLKGDD